MIDGFHKHGFCITAAVFSATEVAELTDALSGLTKEASHQRAGMRNLFRFFPIVTKMAKRAPLLSIAKAAIGPQANPVKATFFDKSPQANWRVPLHQDLTIAVSKKVPTPGFRTWTVKAGIPHVQPPLAILEKMVALRIHLDPCESDSGALWIIPGSHRKGRLDKEAIFELQRKSPAQPCSVQAGDVMLMRPLLVHGSKKARNPTRRRVLHLEYAAESLPGELEWDSPAVSSWVW